MNKDRLVVLENLREESCCCSTALLNDANQDREWDSGFEVERKWKDDD